MARARAYGLKAGLDAGTIEAIRVGKPPNLTKSDEAAVYAFAKELLDTRKVSAATYERAVAEIGLTAVVELVGILGYYSLVSMTINALKCLAADGARSRLFHEALPRRALTRQHEISVGHHRPRKQRAAVQRKRGMLRCPPFPPYFSVGVFRSLRK